jgi:hypothetical protein
MKNWTQLERRNSQIIDAQYAEDFELLPQMGLVNQRASADPARAIIVVKMIFDDPFVKVIEQGDSSRQRSQGSQASTTGISGHHNRLSFDTRNIPYIVRRGDLVRRLATGFLYQINELMADAGAM